MRGKRHARSPQRVARAPGARRSCLHFARIDTHDLRRGLHGHPARGALACISRTRRARSPQRVARAAGKSHSRLHFAHSARTISAEGCARSRHIALSPAFRALDTHDLRRGLHFRLTLFVPPSAFKREFIKWGKCFFIRTSPALVFHTHTCLLTARLHTHCLLTTHCTLAYSLHACNSLLACLHLHCMLCTSLLSLFHLHRATSSVHVVLQVW